MRNNEERFGAQAKIQGGDLADVSALNGGGGLDLNFITPTSYVDLPSKGRFYPEDHPLHNVETIEIKQMTAKEEDILTSKNLLKKGVALDKLIQSLIVNKTVDTDELTAEDRNAILIHARIDAYGPEYNTQVTCPSCLEKVKHKFNLLEEVEKHHSEEEASEEVQVSPDGTFVITLPSTKWNVACRALNGKDEKSLLRISELKKKNGGSDSLLVDQLKLTVVSINGATDQKVLEKAIDVLPAKDSKHLRTEYQKVVKPIDLTQHFTCNSCNYETDMEVPLSADFFWFK
jgi:rubrerythrin